MGSFQLMISVELRDDEVSRIRAAMRTQDDVSEPLGRLALAATEEWLDQILARRLPARIKDVRELRLLHYALHVEGGRLPRPEQISDLFHVTAPESRTLHRNTRTRYAFELEQGVLGALSDALASGTWVAATAGSKGYVRVHMDQALIEFAEWCVSRNSDGPAPRITKDDNYDEYRVPLKSLEVLCGVCGRDYEEVFARTKARASAPTGSER